MAENIPTEQQQISALQKKASSLFCTNFQHTEKSFVVKDQIIMFLPAGTSTNHKSLHLRVNAPNLHLISESCYKGFRKMLEITNYSWSKTVWQHQTVTWSFSIIKLLKENWISDGRQDFSSIKFRNPISRISLVTSDVRLQLMILFNIDRYAGFILDALINNFVRK